MSEKKKYSMLVFSNPTEGSTDADFLEWYAGQHFYDLLVLVLDQYKKKWYNLYRQLMLYMYTKSNMVFRRLNNLKYMCYKWLDTVMQIQ